MTNPAIKTWTDINIERLTPIVCALIHSLPPPKDGNYGAIVELADDIADMVQTTSEDESDKLK